jgi:hypothetical protein
MDRLLRCTCGRDLVVSNSQAGQELTCACGKIVAVPTLRGLAALPLAQALAQTTADAPQPYATSGVGQQLHFSLIATKSYSYSGEMVLVLLLGSPGVSSRSTSTADG